MIGLAGNRGQPVIREGFIRRVVGSKFWLGEHARPRACGHPSDSNAAFQKGALYAQEKGFQIFYFGLAFERDMQIKISTLAMALGVLVILPEIYGILNPAGFAAWVRKFPRSLPWGIFFMLLGTAWFIFYLNQESISDFAAYKPMLLAGFAAVGVASCIYVQDFLAVRGFAVVLLLLAKLMVDTARWVQTDWRLVIVVWAYVMVAEGIWFTIYPWHMRDLLNWGTANEKRVRTGSWFRLAFGLFVVLLGLTVFKGA